MKRTQPPETVSEIARSVRDRIRFARRLGGWSLTEMAERCGIGRTYLYELETRGNPTVGMLVKIAAGTGRPIEWFLAPVPPTCPCCGQMMPEAEGC